MKIVFITPVVPYIDGGTSAHIFHLMLHRGKDIDITIYSFNNNHRSDKDIEFVEKTLSVKVHVVDMPKWIRLFFQLHLLWLRIFLRYPITNYCKLDKKVIQAIKDNSPDGIWVYGEEMSGITKQFPGYRIVHTLPDSEALYYHRMLGQRFVTSNRITYWKNAIMYPKYVRMERCYPVGDNITYHLVGKADVDFLKNNNPSIDARFIHHPHYEISDSPKTISFSQPKIKLLLAGQNNLYMNQSAEEWVECMVKSRGLTEKYDITFLGKGWEKCCAKMKRAGYNANHITFAPNYQDELIKHDIQITPITIGTGTKGKVLDAIANGLLVMGTEYALENIAVEHMESCLVYNNAEEAIELLKHISLNVDRFETMAKKGREAILSFHNREYVSNELFSLFCKQG